MREMDSHFGDLYGMISDREIEISHELAQYVLEYDAMLVTASNICGELDRSVHARPYGLQKKRLTSKASSHWHKVRRSTTCLARVCLSGMRSKSREVGTWVETPHTIDLY